MNPGSASLFRRAYDGAVWALWLLLVLTVPVTSFPAIANLTGRNPVGPLALIPLAVLLVVWLIPHLGRGGKLPAALWPLILFAGVAALSAAVGLALPIAPYKGQSVPPRELRAMVTIAVGLAFYLCASSLPRGEERQRATLRVLTYGGIAMLLWSSVQAWVVLAGRPHIPLRITQLHHLISFRDLVPDRVAGMAYEPSWLGDQLVVLYLPLWLSAVVNRTSVFHRRRSRLSLELFLLIWGGAIFLMTRSRISLVSVALVATVLVVAGMWSLSGRPAARLPGIASAGGGRRTQAARVALVAAALLILAGVIVGGLWVYSRYDPRMGRLFSTPGRLTEIRFFYPNEVGFEVANRLAFGERVVYWVAGYRVFEAYPLLGVGPGNSGFFFEANMPGYGFRLQEIRDVLDPGLATFPNPKNLWVRLLAETGLLGFSVFLSWMILMGAEAWQLLRRGQGLSRVIGLAAGIALVAQVGEGFSLDTFALPHLWVILGILTAAARKLEPDEPAGAGPAAAG